MGWGRGNTRQTSRAAIIFNSAPCWQVEEPVPPYTVSPQPKQREELGLLGLPALGHQGAPKSSSDSSRSHAPCWARTVCCFLWINYMQHLSESLHHLLRQGLLPGVQTRKGMLWRSHSPKLHRVRTHIRPHQEAMLPPSQQTPWKDGPFHTVQCSHVLCPCPKRSSCGSFCH